MFAAHVVHAVPGRARIRIPAKRGDGLYFSALEAGLKSCAQIASIQVNPHSASVLIVFAEDGNLHVLGQYAQEHGLFDLQEEIVAVGHRPLGAVLSDQLGQANRLIARSSRGHLDVQTLFFLLFLGLGLKQLWRGQVMQPAIPLLWRAMEILKSYQK